MKWNNLFLIFLFFGAFRAQVLQHVEPANWWVGMEHHQVQVLLHGQEIAKFKVEVSGLQIIEEIRTENPNYIFLTLETAQKVAGTYPIRLMDKKKEVGRHDFKLETRVANSKFRNSFTSADVIYLLMPDRFANGDPSNDAVLGMKEQVNPNLPGGRHGGGRGAGADRRRDDLQPADHGDCGGIRHLRVTGGP